MLSSFVSHLNSNSVVFVCVCVKREAKLKEQEELNANSKKRLTENQLLIDYLKKELE